MNTQRRLYVGTYTHDSASQGIYRALFDTRTGALTPEGAGPFVADPSYLAIHPSGIALYTCNEMVGPEKSVGSVTALRIDAQTGDLTVMGHESTRGTEPCHVSVDATGRMVMVANYSGGSVIAFPVLADGGIGSAGAFRQHTAEGCDPRRQMAPLAHSIWPDPTNRWALACDKGLDRVMVYRMDPGTASLTPGRVPWARVEPGSGPRHLAFHPNGRWAYVLNESRSSVTCLEWDADRGRLGEFAHVPALPDDYTGRNAAADIHVTADGRFLYATNRGQNALAMFAVDGTTGMLSLIGYEPTQGEHPRNFCLDPSGRWLLAANMRSDAIVVLGIDACTGRLTPTGMRMEMPRPTCIAFAPA